LFRTMSNLRINIPRLPGLVKGRQLRPVSSPCAPCAFSLA
jgi:hypothetical protein